MSLVWKEYSEKKRFGTFTAHPALAIFQPTYSLKASASNGMGIGRISNHEPPGCVAWKPETWGIGISNLQYLFWKTVSHILLVVVPILEEVCCSSGTGMSSWSFASCNGKWANTSRMALSSSFYCSNWVSNDFLALVRIPFVLFEAIGWASQFFGFWGFAAFVFLFSSLVALFQNTPVDTKHHEKATI